MKFSNCLLISFFLAAVLFMASGCAESPRKALFAFRENMEKGAWDDVWKSLSKEDRKKFEEEMFLPFMKRYSELSPDDRTDFTASLDITPQEAEKMTARDFFARTMNASVMKDESGYGGGFDVEQESIMKNRATVKLRNDPAEYYLIKEQGKWHVELLRSMEAAEEAYLRQGPPPGYEMPPQQDESIPSSPLEHPGSEDGDNGGADIPARSEPAAESGQ